MKRQVFLNYLVRFTFHSLSPIYILTLLVSLLNQQNEWQESLGHQVSSMDEERNGQADTVHLDRPPNQEKGILGPGPADLRFVEPFKGVQYPVHNPDESSW